MVELADLRAAATLGTGKEVKSGVFLQIVSLVPKILEKIESKGFIFSLPTLIPAITFSISGVKLTELRSQNLNQTSPP